MKKIKIVAFRVKLFRQRTTESASVLLFFEAEAHLFLTLFASHLSRSRRSTGRCAVPGRWGGLGGCRISGLYVDLRKTRNRLWTRYSYLSSPIHQNTRRVTSYYMHVSTLLRGKLSICHHRLTKHSSWPTASIGCFVYFAVKLVATGHTCCVHTCDFSMPRKHRKQLGLKTTFWVFDVSGWVVKNYIPVSHDPIFWMAERSTGKLWSFKVEKTG